MEIEVKDAYRFFRANGHSAEWALEYAKAEISAIAREWSYEWPWDDDADLSWLEEGQTVEEVLGCVLKDADGKCLASLWGIADPDRAYMRVIQAELASEALAEAFDVGCEALRDTPFESTCKP